MAGEILAAQLHSMHNLHFYHRLMERLRQAILEDKLQELKAEFRSEHSESEGGASGF
jgi:queuine tRNA-ribosyltransferase